jgi:hypothetical protein
MPPRARAPCVRVRARLRVPACAPLWACARPACALPLPVRDVRPCARVGPCVGMRACSPLRPPERPRAGVPEPERAGARAAAREGAHGGNARERVGGPSSQMASNFRSLPFAS